jgi:hypothetical protein
LVHGWRRPRPTSVYALIERKQYARAVEFLKEELKKKKGDRRLRTQLGDVLALAGRPKEALDLYGALADDLALQGQAAQAIAVLKKMQGLAPGREDVEEKLAYLIKQQDAPAPDPWLVKRAAAGIAAPSEIGMEAAPEPPASEIGMEEIADAPPEELDRDEIVALIESALTPGDDGEAGARPVGWRRPSSSPSCADSCCGPSCPARSWSRRARRGEASSWSRAARCGRSCAASGAAACRCASCGRETSSARRRCWSPAGARPP